KYNKPFVYLKPLFIPDLNLEANNKSFRVFLVCINTPLIPEEYKSFASIGVKNTIHFLFFWNSKSIYRTAIPIRCYCKRWIIHNENFISDNNFSQNFELNERYLIINYENLPKKSKRIIINLVNLP
ncbi:unnamed protein product, partial [Tenebrio molitor]